MNAPYVNWFDNDRPNFNRNHVQNPNSNYGSASRGCSLFEKTSLSGTFSLERTFPATEHLCGSLQAFFEIEVLFLIHDSQLESQAKQNFSEIGFC